MKAFVITQKDVFQHQIISAPVPQKGEALIRVKACGVNRLDLYAINGTASISLPHIPGSDISGIIKKINGESTLKADQEVVINPAIPCKKCSRCKRGLSCNNIVIFGYKTDGGYAEYVTVSIEQVYPKPKGLSFAQAAAFPITFLTAWHMLVGRVNLQKGEIVFIWGATGGLGVSTVQIAKYLGAKVIAAVGSEKDIQKVKKIGADYVVVYTRDNILKKINEITNGEKVQVVFESIGSATWGTSLSILEPYGRYVIAGTTSGAEVDLSLYNLYKNQYSIIGASMGTKAEFEEVLQLFSKGKLKTVIDTIFPFKDAHKAIERMKEGKQFGKIVIEV